jgi:putative ATPase
MADEAPTSQVGDEASTASSGTAPLAARMRPRTLDEVVGQPRATAPGSPLRQLVEGARADAVRPASVVLWGPPGCGKTTIAWLLAGSDRTFVQLSAVDAGIKDVRSAIDAARSRSAEGGSGTVLFIDEVHRFSRTQQDALLPAVEHGWITLVAATSENPSHCVVAPLLSRSIVVPLDPLDDAAIAELLERAMQAPQGLGGSVELHVEARDQLVRWSQGDARRALTLLEAAAGAMEASDERPLIDTAALQRISDRAVVRYDRAGDQHYDVISAFIKSIRGSDPDASLHYLARMVEAGEDPRFIARRLVILASEDIGLADPTALTTASAAAASVAFVGMPEARIVLAQATVALALAPKSNAVVVAIDEALSDVRRGRFGPVPPHLRDGHGGNPRASDYVYPHDHADGVVAQQYAPDALVGRHYYRPGRFGDEARQRQVLERLRRVLGADRTQDGSERPLG